jgi:micrococcal nuclease
VLLAACGPQSGPIARPGAATDVLPAGLDVDVQRVVDGDTLVAADERVRLIGVDTPESADPRRPVQCFGREASTYLSKLLPQGTPVRLVADVEQRDRYDRLLAYVYRLSDGMFVNAELVRSGYAQVLTVPPNVAHADRFVTLAAEARRVGRSLWSACPPGDGSGRPV